MILPGQGITSESAPAPNGTTFLVPDFATGPQNQEAARKDSTDPDKGSMQGLDDLKEGTTLHGRARWFAPSPGGNATGPTTWQTEWETTVTDAVPLVLADHHVVFAEGLRMILDAEDDLAVLDVAHHTCRAVELVTEHRPAVLSLDAHLPTGDLVATLAAVKAASPTTKALVLSGDAHPETTAVVMASGADGFLAKASSSRQLASVIRSSPQGNRQR